MRDMVSWSIANPDVKDRQFVDEERTRYGLSLVTAYADLKIVKAILPNMGEASRDFHRWRYNEMILETYQMAKKRKDTKTMGKAATSYAKFNRIDIEDEQSVPYHMIVVQPFFPTTDPRVVGITYANNFPNFYLFSARRLVSRTMAFTLLCRSGTSMMLRIFPTWIVWVMTALSKGHSRSGIPYAR